jgi:hypothetical protein
VSLNYSQTCRSTVAKTLDCCVTKVSASGDRLLLPKVLWIGDAVLFLARDKHIGSYFRELRNNFLGQKYLNSLSIQYWVAGSGMEKSRSGIRDGKIQTRDPG